MINKQTDRLAGVIRPLALAAFLFLVTACGAGIPQETSPTAAPQVEDSSIDEPSVDTTADSLFEESTNDASSISSSTPEALPPGAEVDANGIPVGFTENGNPYRGNPDAPVVIEEYSDFQ